MLAVDFEQDCIKVLKRAQMMVAGMTADDLSTMMDMLKVLAQDIAAEQKRRNQ